MTTLPRRLVAPVTLVALLMIAASVPAATTPAMAASSGSVSKVAGPAEPLPFVGALFRPGTTDHHTCTGTVLAGPGRDLVITAAHCITGDGVGYSFVPGYDAGKAPYGTWSVRRVYVAPDWLHDQEKEDDVAVLQVASQTSGGRTITLQQAVGSGAIPGPSPAVGTPITVVAYNSGIDDDPISCTTTLYRDGDEPAFDCHGYVGGSSGAPWLELSGTGPVRVVGVIGGLNQGGCEEYTSYSARFGLNLVTIYLRALLRTRADTLPTPAANGC